jgi:group I intron endonuclease
MRKEKKYHFIYKTVNLLSGKYYIGMHSTDNLDDGYLGSGTYLRLAIKKHGKENFKREILEFCNSRKELKSLEEQIVNLREIAKKECMNMRVGGSGEDYKKPITTETRKKMSESHIGKVSGMTGKTHTKETRKKISEAGKGRDVSDIHKQKISEWNRQRWNAMDDSDRKFMKLKFTHNAPHTEEAKSKMSKSHMGKKLSEEHKNKISQSKKNPSEETRYKYGNGKRGKPTSEETKLKIGKANSKPQKRIKCPQCGKEGGIVNIKRYHFDNCKFLLKNP